MSARLHSFLLRAFPTMRAAFLRTIEERNAARTELAHHHAIEGSWRASVITARQDADRLEAERDSLAGQLERLSDQHAVLMAGAEELMAETTTLRSVHDAVESYIELLDLVARRQPGAIQVIIPDDGLRAIYRARLGNLGNALIDEPPIEEPPLEIALSPSPSLRTH